MSMERRRKKIPPSIIITLCSELGKKIKTSQVALVLENPPTNAVDKMFPLSNCLLFELQGRVIWMLNFIKTLTQSKSQAVDSNPKHTCGWWDLYPVSPCCSPRKGKPDSRSQHMSDLLSESWRTVLSHQLQAWKNGSGLEAGSFQVTQHASDSKAWSNPRGLAKSSGWTQTKSVFMNLDGVFFFSDQRAFG